MRLPTRTFCVKIIAGLHNVSESSFFGAYVMSDLAEAATARYSISDRAGTGIGDRDYYVEAENAAIKEGYLNFLAKSSLTGVAEPEKAAANALAVEDVLAANSWTSVQERNIQAQYQPLQHRGTHRRITLASTGNSTSRPEESPTSRN